MYSIMKSNKVCPVWFCKNYTLAFSFNMCNILNDATFTDILKINNTNDQLVEIHTGEILRIIIIQIFWDVCQMTL